MLFHVNAVLTQPFQDVMNYACLHCLCESNVGRNYGVGNIKPIPLIPLKAKQCNGVCYKTHNTVETVGDHSQWCHHNKIILSH